jgi:hypothetical protein
MFNKRAVGERIYLVIGEVWEFCSCSFYTAYFELGKKMLVVFDVESQHKKEEDENEIQ